MVTTTSMTVDRVSMRTAQSDWNWPTSMKGARIKVKGSPWPQTWLAKLAQASAQARNSRPVVTAWDGDVADAPTEKAGDGGAQKRGENSNNDEALHRGQPFIMLASSTAMSPRLRKKVTRMANPTAASAAATVSTNMAKI